MNTRGDIGIVGLGVMGRNLALNLADHGYTVAVYNRTAARTRDFVADDVAGRPVIPTFELEELVATLRAPRIVLLMVAAGPPVDRVVDALTPLLDEGDIIIDGGNSLYTDTIRRVGEAERRGLRYVGMGISGGEEGARYGPSIMPGGTPSAWAHIRDMFQAIAAKTPDGTPCCDWVGPDGSGHYVKMVHNGIEYGDMQLIAEAYDLMKASGMTPAEMADVFEGWGRGVLDSYLIDITARILTVTDPDGVPVLDRILDAAGQKGTGKWTVISSMELGQPVTLVAEAVYARIVSSLVDQRRYAATKLPGPERSLPKMTDDIHDALYASKIVSYAQGFMLMAAASAEHDWDLDLGRIAELWRAGCIIRARFLDDISAAYRRRPTLPNLMLDEFFASALSDAQSGWRRVVAEAVTRGLPVPAYATALTFYDSYRSERLPANLIQAQRDFFGAHTYERIDRPRGEFFHTEWTAPERERHPRS